MLSKNFANFQAEFTYQRWRQSNNVMQVIMQRFHVDSGNPVGFVVLWESAKYPPLFHYTEEKLL